MNEDDRVVAGITGGVVGASVAVVMAVAALFGGAIAVFFALTPRGRWMTLAVLFTGAVAITLSVKANAYLVEKAAVDQAALQDAVGAESYRLNDWLSTVAQPVNLKPSDAVDLPLGMLAQYANGGGLDRRISQIRNPQWVKRDLPDGQREQLIARVADAYSSRPDIDRLERQNLQWGYPKVCDVLTTAIYALDSRLHNVRVSRGMFDSFDWRNVPARDQVVTLERLAHDPQAVFKNVTLDENALKTFSICIRQTLAHPGTWPTTPPQAERLK